MLKRPIFHVEFVFCLILKKESFYPYSETMYFYPVSQSDQLVLGFSQQDFAPPDHS